MKKREKDQISALFLLAAALAICLGSFRLSLGEVKKPGPGLFPFLIGSILGVLSLLIFMRSSKGISKEEEGALWPHPQRSLKMTYILVALIVYAVGMSYLGFFLSTLLFLGFLLKGIEPQRWSVVLSVSIIGTIIFYGIFKYWLDIPFPEGILGF
jgi:putative tricarboxylic transport membrane protein